jgi:hypothetical protein
MTFIFGNSPWDFLSAFLKVPNGMSYILEVPHIIFGNFGSFSSDFVHFWKLLLGCCVFMEVPHGNCCIKYAQNPMRKFQNAQNPTKNFQKYPTRNIQ